MPKKLGLPDENRKKAVRLIEQDVFDADFENDGLRVSSSGEKRQKKGKTAKQYATYLVSIKTYTEHSLREKLRTKEYTGDEIDDAIEYVKSFGYINDLRVAQNTAERLARKLYGKRRILAYLSSKGITGEVISRLDFEEIDFKENCAILASRLAARGKTDKNLAAALSRAGFTSSEIYFAMSVI